MSSIPRTKDQRERLLEDWARLILTAVTSGHLDGRPLIPARILTVAGPRVGALHIQTRPTGPHIHDAGRLLDSLSKRKGAMLRQLIPATWRFHGKPQVFMTERYVRLEVPWPDNLIEHIIRLRDMKSPRPTPPGRWTAGQNEFGQIITVGFNDGTPHWLLAGQTGAGKTIGVQGALSQLCLDSTNQIVMLDGKGGVALTPLAHVRKVGPLIYDLETARDGLGWVYTEVQNRLRLKREGRPKLTRLIVAWDEPQDWLKADSILADLFAKILAQGREVHVHVLVATHNPTVGTFGEGTSSKRNVPGRIAMRVDSPEASRVAVGKSDPRADYLSGAGDSYIIGPKHVMRTLLMFVDDTDFRRLPAGPNQFDTWPTWQPETVRSDPGDFSVQEIALSLLAASMRNPTTGRAYGRPALRNWVHEITGHKPGGSRSQRLQRLGKDLYSQLKSWGIYFVKE